MAKTPERPAVLADLPEDQRGALVRYRQANRFVNGRTWRDALQAAWRNGAAGPELQRLRNGAGPAWLARLPESAFDVVEDPEGDAIAAAADLADDRDALALADLTGDLLQAVEVESIAWHALLDARETMRYAAIKTAGKEYLRAARRRAMLDERVADARREVTP